jgi:hypothetical protein
MKKNIGKFYTINYKIKNKNKKLDGNLTFNLFYGILFIKFNKH